MVKVLVGPAQRVVVGLADAAEVAGDRLGAAEVEVGAVGALGVERLDVAGADDLHRRGDGEDVLAGARLLGHVAHADVAARHELTLADGLPGLGDEPGEVLQGADLQGDGVLLVDVLPVGRVAEDAARGTRAA